MHRQLLQMCWFQFRTVFHDFVTSEKQCKHHEYLHSTNCKWPRSQCGGPALGSVSGGSSLGVTWANASAQNFEFRVYCLPSALRPECFLCFITMKMTVVCCTTQSLICERTNSSSRLRLSLCQNQNPHSVNNAHCNDKDTKSKVFGSSNGHRPPPPPKDKYPINCPRNE